MSYREVIVDMLEALLAAKAYGSQGTRDEDGISVDFLIENAIQKAEGILK